MMKFRVGAGVYGCKWRRKGLDGCGRVQGAWGGTETMDADTKMVMQALILGPMAGEISPDMMFCAFSKNG